MARERTKVRYGVVWDFDDVLFDTARFKAAIASMLKDEGYARGEVLRTFAVAKDTRGYSPDIHAKMLAAGPREAKRVAALIRRHLRSHGESLLWPDAKRLLRALRARKVPMYLLSAGNPEFQRLKIDASGLRSYFKKRELVDITEPDGAGKTKVRVVKKFLADHAPLLFLDDRPKNIAAIRNERAFRGRVTPILIDRSAAKLTLAFLRRATPQGDF